MVGAQPTSCFPGPTSASAGRGTAVQPTAGRAGRFKRPAAASPDEGDFIVYSVSFIEEHRGGV